ncbi:NAD-dependent epimerase/dehydratase family protein [Paenibacillus sp. GCM10027628]|uniref:NAD-dependent epimerase/dehydratase family protein n=1 Tax=Paenibacillus sp. GCM10027628 TaxID=3273413 RepID=UPI003634EF78
MKILVTGGAGFIASHVTDELIAEGHQVAVVDNLSTGKSENLNEHAAFYHVDISDQQLEDVFEQFQPEVVIHHAAQIDVKFSMQDPIRDSNINIIGSLQVLELSRKYNVRKIIYASSAAVYGAPEFLGITELHPIKPQSCYGISKHTFEHYLEVYSQLYGLDYTILRYANVYGLRQDPKGEGGVISIFIDKLLARKNPFIHGDGEQTRDFIYVKDVVQANLCALTKGSRLAINIGTNTQTSINQLFSLLCDLSKINMEPVYQASRQGDIQHSRLDNNLAAKCLDWRPNYSLMDGLAETFQTN